MTRKPTLPLALLFSLSVVVNVSGQVCSSTNSSLNICVPSGDEIWLVSAREFECGMPVSTDALQYQKYCQGQWMETSCFAMADVDDEADLETVVFVHGYQTDLPGAQKRGLQVYQNLFGQKCCRSPVRYVIWAWKSERENHRPVKDFNTKSRHAMTLADIFAVSLNEMGAKPPVVIGYSLGGQVVISALTQSNCYCGAPIQLVVIAAANDCGFLSNCDQMPNCGNIARSFIFANDEDRAIRAAKVICKIKFGKQFESFDELAVLHSEQLGQINIIDLSEIASHQHSIVKYSSIPVVRSCIQQLVFENGVKLREPGRTSRASKSVVAKQVSENGLQASLQTTDGLK